MNEHEAHSHGTGAHEVSSHEQSDANIPSIVWFGIGVVILIAVSAVAMLVLFKFLEARPEPAVSALAQQREVPPTPRLQVSPMADLEGMRADEQKVLETYGWVDKDGKVARIPIERAIDLLMQKGFPATAGKPEPPKKPEVKR